MKKLIKLTIIFTIILSLTFIPTFQTNAASKVNITYYAGKGHFKAKPNRSKNKITIKNKLNKKRGYSYSDPCREAAEPYKPLHNGQYPVPAPSVPVRA